jgi:hypothetical protein
MTKSNRWSKTVGIALAVCVPALAVAAVELPHVFKAGEKVSAAEMNENFEALQAKLQELEQRLDAEKTHVAYDTLSPFDIPNDGFAALAYNVKRTDALGEYVGGKFTPKAAGDYLVCASLAPPSSDQTLSFEVDVFVNDSRGSVIAYAAGSANIAAGCTVRRLANGDILDVRAHTPSAAIISKTMSEDNYDWLTITRVH